MTKLNDLNMYPIANAATNFLINNLKVDNEYNLFNQPNTIMPVGAGLGMSAIEKFTGYGFGPIPVAVDMAETWDYYKKRWTDYSGKTATYNVFTDGSIKLAE
jgi:hypothetical protein